MRIVRRAFNNRLASRIVALFVAAALLPLILLALLTISQVGDELQQQGSHQARESAKSIGMDIFERLNSLTEKLQIYARAISNDPNAVFYSGLVTDEVLYGRHVEALFTLDPEGGLELFFGRQEIDGRSLLNRIHQQRIPAKVSLLITPAESGKHGLEIYLFSPLAAEQPNGSLLGLRINQESLWDREQLESRPELICILGERGSPLYCNREPPGDWISKLYRQELRQSVNAPLNAEQVLVDGLLSASWSLFLAPHYQVKQWTVGVGIPADAALAPAQSFNRNLILVMLLSLVLITFLSIRSIRTTLDPLGKLLEATRSLSNGVFMTRVAVTGSDEFAELGDSFNDMASRLGRHFRQQQTLTQLSQALQQADSVEQIMGVLFAHFEALLGAAQIGALFCSGTGAVRQGIVWPITTYGHLVPPTIRFSDQNYALPEEILQAESSELLRRYPVVARLSPVPGIPITLLPVQRNGAQIALLAFYGLPIFQAEDERVGLLRQLSEILAIALDNSQLQQQLRHQAFYDALTDLPNRVLMSQRVQELLQSAQQENGSLAVIILDIDRFKTINDSLGHAAGDELLRLVAERLKRCLQPDEILSRFAGDEFVLIVPCVVEKCVAESAISRIHHAFQQPFSIGERRLNISASTGVTLFPQDGGDYLTLLKNADAALYQAKAGKSGSSAFYSHALQQALNDRLSTEQDLKQAIRNEEFVLFYQPAVRLDNHSVIGCEALVRWMHPEKGLLMPNHFIEIAEQTGQIGAIGLCVLKQACRDFRRWQMQKLNLEYVAVNVSGLQLQDPSFATNVADIIAATGMLPQQLELEVTETALIEDFAASLEKLMALRQLGVRIAVDDFGTGYASLKYLKTLPADKLKIDRLFVSELPGNERDGAIVKSVCTLALQLRMSLLAEGVETSAQAEFLRACGVYSVQGYHFSKPLPEPQFVAFARDREQSSVA
ncbi:MAG: EAL domain-containing protein [Chromatiaceae bacterium]|nr:EAL domain-containing protein [Chromatiaceae bacterium]MCP5447537.1 EAL domain-containing protein [Chromatiaceae bacterium]